MKLRNNIIAYLYLAIIPLYGCGVYSFTGASIAPEIKTISIDTFFDEIGSGPPNLSQVFTEKIKDYFQQNTNLSLVEFDGDLQLEGAIVRYDLAPLAPAAGGNQNIPGADVAGLQRLTITVKATYVNNFDDEFNFDQSFSFYDDYNPSSTTLAAVEDQLVDVIFDQIIVDIFNASVANW
ncbi:MAG: LptE family protein [Cyclobacteriaceae bacterium]|nr:LptE family protein [Cyclobacteriaceae bacterium]